MGGRGVGGGWGNALRVAAAVLWSASRLLCSQHCTTHRTRLGVPVVCTSIAVSGMHATHGKDVLLADSPEAMAAAVMAAYYNATTWHRLAWPA